MIIYEQTTLENISWSKVQVYVNSILVGSYKACSNSNNIFNEMPIVYFINFYIINESISGAKVFS